MPIKGLTDQQASFPRLGILRKGAPRPENGKRPGKDLDHFRFDTDDLDALEAFREHYGDEPRQVKVFLPYANTEDNFPTWQEEWVAGGLVHRCDGETCVLWRTDDGTYSREPKPCPDGCSQVGKLKVIIPELRRLAYVDVLTGSKWDIMELHGTLMALEMARGDLRGIPFVLRRRPRRISTPDGKGGRVRREKWLLSIEPEQQWVERQLVSMQHRALPGVQQMPESRQLVDTMTGEILDDGEELSDDLAEVEPVERDDAPDTTRETDRQVGDVDYADLIDRIDGKCRTFADWCREKHVQSGRVATDKQYGYLAGVLDHIAGEKDMHRPILEVLCGREVTGDKPPGFELTNRLLDWLPENKPGKDENGNTITNPDHKPEYVECIKVILRLVREANGQGEEIAEAVISL